MSLKILVVFGTRPEAIKLAPVIKELRMHSDQVTCRVCATGQHREMLDQVLRLFDIEPDYHLGVMQDNQSPTQVAAVVLAQLEPILLEEKPDWVLVQGDTTTVAVASLAAYYAQAKVGHVEAGLRTHDKWQPFPEEINRRIASVVADLHFAPTTGSRQNLLCEGVPAQQIVVTGNPVIDALQWVAGIPYDPGAGPLADIPLDKRIVLVTAHRRESFGKPLESICLSLKEIAEGYRDSIHMVYAVHPNPSVKEPVYRLLGGISNITLLPPLDYLHLVHLMKQCHLVLTDSGGIQEEAPGLGKPVLVLRQVTERPEAVEAGTVRLVGTDPACIVEWTRRLLDDSAEYGRMARAVNPYGDGQAAPKIVQALLVRRDE